MLGTAKKQLGRIREEFRDLERTRDAGRRRNFLSKLADLVPVRLEQKAARNVARGVGEVVGDIESRWEESDLDDAARLIVSVSDPFPQPDVPNPSINFLTECITSVAHDGVASKILVLAVRQRSRGSSAQLNTQKVLDDALMGRMETEYGPSARLQSIDLRLSHPFAFSRWGFLLRDKSGTPISAPQNPLRQFWLRYIDSPEKLAQFSRQILRAYDPNMIGPEGTTFSTAQIISTEDLASLLERFPPSTAKTDLDRESLEFAKEFLSGEVETTSSG